MPQSKVVLLIDGDNIKNPDHIAETAQCSEEYGDLGVRRAYFNRAPTGELKDVLTKTAIKPVVVKQTDPGLDTVDVAMVVDVMKILYGPSRNHTVFCIASDDTDFILLIEQMRSKTGYSENLKVYSFATRPTFEKKTQRYVDGFILIGKLEKIVYTDLQKIVFSAYEQAVLKIQKDYKPDDPNPLWIPIAAMSARLKNRGKNSKVNGVNKLLKEYKCDSFKDLVKFSGIFSIREKKEHVPSVKLEKAPRS